MQRQNLDAAWQFRLGDPPRWPQKDTGAGWQDVDLPHDWSIGLARDPDAPSTASGGFFPMGRGWYRKTLNVPETWSGKKILIEFEGVYMNAEIWLNDDYLGRHPYGYTTFHIDLTPYLKPGEPNVLKVKVDNATQMNSRWYSGSGIYRHVWLLTGDQVHVAPWGVYVTTPEVTAASATVRVETQVRNESKAAQTAKLRARLRTPDGNIAGAMETPLTLEAGKSEIGAYEIDVASPRLWSPNTPDLYQVETELLVDGKVIDSLTTPFGIRSIQFDAQQGFLLNGKPTLLRGGCVHHDNGVMGAEAHDRSEERKVEVLKASGFNAVRCAHNPPSPAFLDACDRLGMLVIDEAFDCWREGKTPYDYHVAFEDWWQIDLNSMVLRDRNHPSVIMWSIGNEVHERNGKSNGAVWAASLADYIRLLDPTRPITAGVNGGGDAWPWEETDAIFAALDVGGYNYQERQYRPDHQRHPERVMYGSESTAEEAFDHWESVKALSHVVGDFVWTSLDYLGEAGIGRVHDSDEMRTFLGAYPWHQANCGDLDICGFKRPQSYYRDILWERGSPLYIAVHHPVPGNIETEPKTTYWGWPEVSASWTWPEREGETITVDVYAAGDEVELFLNGASLGRQPAGPEQRHIATFEVPYAPGELKAVGYTGGEQVATCSLATTGAPAALRLTPDRAQLASKSGDLSFVTVEVVDAKGRRCPNATDTIFLTVQGEGRLAAVGSGDPVSTERYRSNQRRAYQGRCLAVVKAYGKPGDITLRAQADGLATAATTITVA